MLTCEDAVLIVIDAQGKLARVVADSERSIGQIRKLVQGACLLNVPVLLTAQVPEKLGHTVPEIATLLPEQDDIPRVSFSVLAESQVADRLADLGRRQVILSGFETHICLYQSALDLLGASYQVYLATDAVSSRSLSDKTTALTELAGQGVHLVTVEMVLFSLLRDANHPAFKAVSALIK
ncbi:MAG: isochorismatase family protein [Anaerolineaceae bacterium]